MTQREKWNASKVTVFSDKRELLCATSVNGKHVLTRMQERLKWMGMGIEKQDATEIFKN